MCVCVCVCVCVCEGGEWAGGYVAHLQASWIQGNAICMY